MLKKTLYDKLFISNKGKFSTGELVDLTHIEDTPWVVSGKWVHSKNLIFFYTSFSPKSSENLNKYPSGSWIKNSLFPSNLLSCLYQFSSISNVIL